MHNAKQFSEWADDELWTLRMEIGGRCAPGAKAPYEGELNGEGHNLASWYITTLAGLDAELASRGLLRGDGGGWELPAHRDKRLTVK